MTSTVTWLLTSDEPWTRYRARVDLLGQSEAEARADRDAMLAHPQVHALREHAATWGRAPLTRHNDAKHALTALGVLADFGLRRDDPGMAAVVDSIAAHRDPQGPLQTVLNIHPRFGGSGQDTWSWMACDAPNLLYLLLRFGGHDDAAQAANAHLVGQLDAAGWGCKNAPELGSFRGPGRKADACPLATLLAVKALSLLPEHRESEAVARGAELLLDHWATSRERKRYLFGAGKRYRALKFPFLWYDLLHVADVLGRCPSAQGDPRYAEMRAAIAAHADADGRFTATSKYMAWRGWSFSDKKQASPWMTLLALRVALNGV